MSSTFERSFAQHLLTGMACHCSPAEQKACLSHCAGFHYENTVLKNGLEKYTGDLSGFIEFASGEWGWMINVDEAENKIYVDENKNYCACPIVNNTDAAVSDVLCECSNMFIGKLFSLILQKDVQASVVRSYLRDKQSCVYEVTL